MSARGQSRSAPWANGAERQELLDEFQADMALRSRAVRRDLPACAARAVGRMLWRMAAMHPQDITIAAIKRCLVGITADGKASKTLRNYLSAMSGFCEFLVEKGLLSKNPCRSIHLAPLERRVPRYLLPDELEGTLAIARKCGVWPAVMLAVSTGLRLGELVRLRWRDVDFDHRQLLVTQSKSGRPRAIPLCTDAIAALQSQYRLTAKFQYVFPARRTWRGGWRYIDQPRSEQSFRRGFVPIQKAVPKFRSCRGTGRAWHLLRHTFASRLAQAGVSLYKIAQWMGHSDVKTTQIYAHLQPGFDPEIEAGHFSSSQGDAADDSGGTLRLFDDDIDAPRRGSDNAGEGEK